MITTNDAWLCYSFKILFNDQWLTPYIGVCPASTFSSLPDANCNSLFIKDVRETDQFEIVLHGAYNTEAEAEAMRQMVIKVLPKDPWFNTQGEYIEPRKSGRSQQLRDKETGVIYDNAAHVSRVFNVTASMVSKHLNGKAMTCGGTTFERVT